jgi:predicted porin
MKKHALPLKALTVAVGLAASAPVLAQSSVTVTGLVDVFVGSMRNSGDPSSTTQMGSNGMTTSWFGFEGVEDLGGGMKATTSIEAFFRPSTGQSGRFDGDETLFSRDANIGLSGGFGGITLGRGLAPNFLPTVIFNPFGDSFTFSPLVLQSFVPTGNFPKWTWQESIQGDTGWSNEVIYQLPSMIGGLTLNLFYEFGNEAGNSGHNNTGFNLLYFHGPLALTAYYENIKVDNPLDTGVGLNGIGVVQDVFSPSGLELTAARQTTWMVGGSYELPVVKLFATYQETTHDVDLTDKTGSLGAKIPAGTGNILLAWAETTRKAPSIMLNLNRDTETIGYDYPLSKRTDLYANLMHDKVEDLNAGNSFGVGIRHAF